MALCGCANLKFKEVDCALSKDICNELNINHNPSYLTFEKNELLEVYHGQRDLESMRRYCLSLLGFRFKRSPSNPEEVVEPEHTSMALTVDTFDEEIKNGITIVM